MTDKFSNSWTREIEKLQADKAALLEACKDATYLRRLVEKADWLKRHKMNYGLTLNDGNIADIERRLNQIIDKLHAAIAQAERK